jgi:ABC-type polysaccharide transport system permease subunit
LFWRAAVNNLKIVALSILIQLPVGIALGYLLDSAGRKLNILKVLWFIPYLLSSVAIGLLFRYAYDPYFGIVKYVAQFFGMTTIDLLGDPGRALYAVIAVICWQFTPFYMVYFLAGLSSMDTDIYEAALIDGATRGQYFFKIVLPILSPTIRNACVFIPGRLAQILRPDLRDDQRRPQHCLRRHHVRRDGADGHLHVQKRVHHESDGLCSGHRDGHVPDRDGVSAVTMRMMTGKERS